MASPIESPIESSLDSLIPAILQIGEKGHLEFCWSNDINERIVQFSFQLTRTKNVSSLKTLSFQATQILIDLNAEYADSKISKDDYIEYISLFYRMIGHTRDIIDGKGEYMLSYMLLEIWHKMYPELAKFAFKQFITCTSVHPFGSWKDLKYLHKYSKENNDCLHDLVSYGIELMNEQLKIDAVSRNPSLAAKWAPRESSQFSDLFTVMATQYFSSYLKTATTETSKTRAILKAKTGYRKLISAINIKLQTTQIKQCANNWSQIDPEKQTSVTMYRQIKAFLNLKKNGSNRCELEDRILCANNFKEYANKAYMNECSVKGKRIGLNDFTREALSLISNSNIDGPEAQILNAQWRNNSTQNGALGKMIAMVDVSGTMMGEPLHAAIALGIRVAEKSILGKRILTFSASPRWINLTQSNNFIDMVKIIQDCDWGMNTNFYAALNLILSTIVSSKLSPDDVENMVLTVFSDMQIDEYHDKQTGQMETMMAQIELLYAAAGNKLWNKPFKPPHILFWNLRSTSGFPTLSLKKNTSMMSGFSPALLNVFCDNGISALHSCTPWYLLSKALNNPRYNMLDREIRRVLL